MIPKFLLLICIVGVLNGTEIWSLEDIEHSTEWSIYPNQHKIKQDFVKLLTGKTDPGKEFKTKQDNQEDLDDFLKSLPTLKAEYYKSLTTTKKPGIHTFDWERGNESKHNELNVKNHTAKINGPNFIINKTSLKQHVPQMLPLAKESGNLVEARVLLPAQPLQPYGAFNFFNPMDQFANMIIFKVGMDSMSPYRTQSSQMALRPNTLMPFNTRSQQQFPNYGLDPSFQYLINSVEGPLNEQSRSVIYEPSLVFRKPIHYKEPKQLIDLIENTLDLVKIEIDGDDGNTDKEIEIHCPVHHKKKSHKGHRSINGTEKDGGAKQVCTCGFIKNTKKDITKERK